MEFIWEKIGSYITSDNVAFLSVIITVLIFIITRHAEIRYKKYDDKKVQYLKLIDLMQKFSNSKKDENGETNITNETRKQFFDTGASLLLYGSKKIYRQYLLFREFTTNPLIKQCKYYKDNIAIFIMADIFRTMRKEVGLSYFNNIRSNEALAFFVNDISSNPIAKENAMDAMFRIKMVRFELAVIDRSRFICIKSIYTTFVRPLFAGVLVIWKYVIIVPFGRLIIRIFPKTVQKIQENQNTTK